MWSEKYRPGKRQELLGNRKEIDGFYRWLKLWPQKGKKRAALLIGPPGSGKTTLAHIAAAEMGFNLVEVNASDSRSKKSLTSKISVALGSLDLTGARTLVFLDEVDGLSGVKDYGAVEYIKEAIAGAANPIVMAANDRDSQNVQKLIKSCSVFEILPLPEGEIAPHLERIAMAEGLEMNAADVKAIIKTSRGDMRAALNMLQTGSVSERTQDMSEEEAMAKFFAAKTREEALQALAASGLKPEEKERLIFNSVMGSKTMAAEEKLGALRALSDLDVLIGKMKKAGWLTIRYVDPTIVEMSAGWRSKLSYSKYEPIPFPMLLRIWNEGKKIRAFSEKMAPFAHIGSEGFRTEDMPYLLFLMKDRGFRERILREVDAAEYAEFFAKSK